MERPRILVSLVIAHRPFSQIEIWNEWTEPIRLIRLEGEWVEQGSFERSGKPRLPRRGIPFRLSVNIVTEPTLNMFDRERLVHPTDVKSYVDLELDYVPEATPVPVLVRLYESSPLRLRLGETMLKLNEVGNSAILAGSTGILPLRILGDEYFLPDPRPRGYTYIEENTFASKSPIPDIVSDLAKVYSRTVRELARMRTFSFPPDQVPAGLPLNPINYRLNGHPPDLTLPFPAEYAGLSPCMPWYYTRPAVEPGWMIARLEEILRIRGKTLAAWRAQVDRFDTLPPNLVHELLADHLRLIQIHSTTRQYQYDHYYDWETKTRSYTDTMRRTLTVLDDCDGSAASSYAIAMTMLFPPDTWTSPDLARFQRVARALGVPFGVIGTSRDPEKTSSGPGSGHVFTCFIPIESYRKMTAEKPTSAITILESIYMTTPYYRVRESSRKSAEMHRIRDILARTIENGHHSDWVHATTAYDMGPLHQAQGYVIRMFTQFDEFATGERGVKSFVPRVPGSRTAGIPVLSPPPFILEQVTPIDLPAHDAELSLIRRFEHPIIPLPANARDEMALDPDWRETFRSLFPFPVTPGLPPSDPDSRAIFYLYDITGPAIPQALDAIRKILSPTPRVYLENYGWALAVISQI